MSIANSVNQRVYMPSSRTISSDTTLALSDVGNVILCDSATSFVVSPPTQAAVPLNIGAWFKLYNQGLADVTVNRSAGDILDSPTLLIAPNAEMVLRLDAISSGVNFWRGIGGTLVIPFEIALNLNGTVGNISWNATQYCPVDATITDIFFGCRSGSGTGTPNISGVNITGGAMTFSAGTYTRVTPTALNTIKRGDYVQVTFSGTSTLTDPAIIFTCTRRE